MHSGGEKRNENRGEAEHGGGIVSKVLCTHHTLIPKPPAFL